MVVNKVLTFCCAAACFGFGNKSLIRFILKNYGLQINKKNCFLYYSGLGSHEIKLIEEYIKTTRNYLISFANKPSVIDLGCGDFNIGPKLSKKILLYLYCDRYI